MPSMINKRTLALLASDKKLDKSDQNDFEVLHEFFRTTDPSADTALNTLMFDIAKNFFKPIHISLAGLNPQVQKRLILDLIAQGPDVDADLARYMQRLKDLDSKGNKIKGDLTSTERAFEKSGTDMNTIKQDTAQHTMLMTKLDSKSALTQPMGIDCREQHEFSKVTFDFCVRESSVITKDGGEPAFELMWTIRDPLLNKVEKKSVRIKNPASTGAKKLRIVDDYMNGRTDAMKEKQEQQASDIKSLGRHFNSVAFNKEVLQASKYNYEDYKRMMNERYAMKQTEKMNNMRASLRNLYRNQNKETRAIGK